MRAAGRADSRADSPADSLANMRSAVISVVLDVCAMLAFVAIGRHTHHDGDSLAGVLYTAGPFLLGLAIGLLAVRAWRRPLAPSISAR